MTYRDGRLDVELFDANPCLFLDKAIKEYVASSPINRLTTFNHCAMFDEPVVVFANGDDPIFQDFKTVIGAFHLTPREALEMHVQSKDGGWRLGVKKMENVSVISYLLPIHYEARLGERQAPYGGSIRYNHTRWRGGVFRKTLADYIASLLEVMGHNAVAPSEAKFFEIKEKPEGRVANWSERHVAYASGLGTFGLNGLIISPKGSAVQLGSVVCDVTLTPTPRAYENHLANCLFYQDGSCRQCIKRCIAGAISEQQGRDNLRCLENLSKNQLEILRKTGGDKGLIGRAPACGLCSTKVPCEDKIPRPKASAKKQ